MKINEDIGLPELTEDDFRRFTESLDICSDYMEGNISKREYITALEKVNEKYQHVIDK